MGNLETFTEETIRNGESGCLTTKYDADIDEFFSILDRICVRLRESEKNILRVHLIGLESSFENSNDTSPWFKHSKRGAMLEDHLLLSGLSELTMPENCIIFGCNTAQWFMAGAARFETPIAVDEAMAKNIKRSILEVWCRREVPPSFIIPVNIRKSHWGAVFGTLDPKNETN